MVGKGDIRLWDCLGYRSTIVTSWCPCYSTQETSALGPVEGTGRGGPFHASKDFRE